MPMNNFSSESSEDTPRTPATTKKPYEKPSFRFEQVFVTSALSCGKVGGTSSSCNSSPKVS
jgi:hypothetical protein